MFSVLQKTLSETIQSLASSRCRINSLIQSSLRQQGQPTATTSSPSTQQSIFIMPNNNNNNDPANPTGIPSSTSIFPIPTITTTHASPATTTTAGEQATHASLQTSDDRNTAALKPSIRTMNQNSRIQVVAVAAPTAAIASNVAPVSLHHQLQQLNVDLCCDECTTRFDEEMHEAKLLYCMHSVCLSCINSKIKSKGEDTSSWTFDCPFCEKSHACTEPNGDQFPQNVFIMNSVRMATSKKLKSNEGTSTSSKAKSISSATTESLISSKKTSSRAQQKQLAKELSQKDKQQQQIQDVLLQSTTAVNVAQPNNAIEVEQNPKEPSNNNNDNVSLLRPLAQQHTSQLPSVLSSTLLQLHQHQQQPSNSIARVSSDSRGFVVTRTPEKSNQNNVGNFSNAHSISMSVRSRFAIAEKTCSITESSNSMSGFNEFSQAYMSHNPLNIRSQSMHSNSNSNTLRSSFMNSRMLFSPHRSNLHTSFPACPAPPSIQIQKLSAQRIAAGNSSQNSQKASVLKTNMHNQDSVSFHSKLGMLSASKHNQKESISAISTAPQSDKKAPPAVVAAAVGTADSFSLRMSSQQNQANESVHKVPLDFRKIPRITQNNNNNNLLSSSQKDKSNAIKPEKQQEILAPIGTAPVAAIALQTQNKPNEIEEKPQVPKRAEANSEESGKLTGLEEILQKLFNEQKSNMETEETNATQTQLDSETTARCPIHKEKFSYYCQSHDAVFCFRCHQHSFCDRVDLIESIHSEKQSRIEDLLKISTNSMIALSECNEHYTKIQEKVDEKEKAQIARIERTFDEVFARLLKKKESLIRDVVNSSKRTHILLASRLECIKEGIEGCEKALSVAEHLKTTTSSSSQNQSISSQSFMFSSMSRSVALQQHQTATKTLDEEYERLLATLNAFSQTFQKVVKKPPVSKMTFSSSSSFRSDFDKITTSFESVPTTAPTSSNGLPTNGRLIEGTTNSAALSGYAIQKALEDISAFIGSQVDKQQEPSSFFLGKIPYFQHTSDYHFSLSFNSIEVN